MALIELKITNLKNILNINLTLPLYQRPYSWSVKSVNTLFYDTYSAFRNDFAEYRLGSVILHKENDKDVYNIVDGQQRLTTLSILFYCLGDKGENQGLMQSKYGKLSNDIIVTNYRTLLKKVNELSDEERDNYKSYLFDKCTMVQIVTDSEQEAFQFFDSQNYRGKELAPHDLLKSYHLREMHDEDETQKVKIINRWENMNQDNLHDLFKNYLYPLTQWYKQKEGLDYSSDTINSFKGIKRLNAYNYAVYHKASNLYVEQFNAKGNSELIGTEALNQFQLTQPLIAGKRFFEYTLHYQQLLEKVQKKIDSLHNKKSEIPESRTGDIYIKQLYECLLMFFADRFSLNSLTKSVMMQLYTWAYSLRLSMNSVYLQTVNKYAKGKHEGVKNGDICMFAMIAEMTTPDDLTVLVFEEPDVYGKSAEENKNNCKKYKTIYELLCDWNGWCKENGD